MRKSNRELEREREHERQQKYLMRAWHRWHADELTQALGGPHGPVFAELVALLEDLSKTTPDNLIMFIRSVDWSVIGYEERLVALHEVNQSIVRYRVRRGLPPLDDGVPGDLNNTFRRIRRILTVYPYETGAMSGPTPTEIKRHQIEDRQS